MFTTAVIERVEVLGNQIHTTVILTGDSGEKEPFTVIASSANLSLEFIRNSVRSYLDSIINKEDVLKLITPGTSIDLTPKTDSTPSLRDIWSVLVGRVVRARGLVDLGLLDSNAKELTDIKSEAIAAYDKSFI